VAGAGASDVPIALLAEFDGVVAAGAIALAVGEAASRTVGVVGAIAFLGKAIHDVSPHRFSSTDAWKLIAPGPGNPAVVLIADALVAGIQKVETEVLRVVLGDPIRTIGSRKQRWFFPWQGPLPEGQLLSVWQPISGAPAQVCSIGPATHSPSPTASPAI